MATLILAGSIRYPSALPPGTAKLHAAQSQLQFMQFKPYPVAETGVTGRSLIAANQSGVGA